MYLNVELNSAADHHHGELPDLANTLRVATHNGPNSQLGVLDDPNQDAYVKPERTAGTLNTAKEAARPIPFTFITHRLLHNLPTTL